MRTIRVDEVRREAAGRWGYILADLLPQLGPALERPGRHVDCPFHGGRRDFRAFRDVAATGGAICTCGAWSDGFALLMHGRGRDFPTVLVEVADWLGLLPEPGRRGPNGLDRHPCTAAAVRRSLPPRVVAPDVPSARWRAGLLRQTWHAARPVDGSEEQVCAYLRSRGLSVRQLIGVSGVRFHRALAYVDEDHRVSGAYPALLFVLSDARGRAVTLHRLYLAADGAGKAPVPSPRKMMPVPEGRSIAGGAIRLAPAGRVLGVAEGVETALAVNRATGMACWSCACADVLAAFEPPQQVRRVCIWTDRDRSAKGEQAAARLQARLSEQGGDARILLPPAPPVPGRKGIDWADVLIEQGLYGFPGPAIWRVD